MGQGKYARPKVLGLGSHPSPTTTWV